MTPNLLPLYLSCFAMIGLLAGFARHNKKTGWEKKRSSLFQDLVELQAFAQDLEGELGREPKSILPKSTPSLHEVTAFTAQMSGLHGALKKGASEAAVVEQAKEREHVSV